MTKSAYQSHTGAVFINHPLDASFQIVNFVMLSVEPVLHIVFFPAYLDIPLEQVLILLP
jgi:hypothetical protein